MEKEILKTLEILEAGGIILYPTDTVWGIGCDATNEEAVNQVYRLKRRSEAKTMLCLVANDAMLERHVEQVPDMAYDIMDLSEKPVTLIYDNPKGIASNLITSDNTMAIRVARDKFCRTLIQRFKKPIVSTSANLAGESTPAGYSEISEPIKNGVDYVVNLKREASYSVPSSIIKLSNDGTVKVIRE